MTGIVRESLQALVDDSYQWFVDIVAERRGLERPRVLTLADGRIVTGRQAVDNKLIDAIGGEAEAIAWLETDKQLTADLPVLTYYPQARGEWFDLPRWLGDAAKSSLGLGAAGPIALDGLVSVWQVASAM
jgi:protease-4